MIYYAADLINSFLQLFSTMLSLLLFCIEEMHSWIKQIYCRAWEIKATRQKAEVHAEAWGAGKMKAMSGAIHCASYCVM